MLHGRGDDAYHNDHETDDEGMTENKEWMTLNSSLSRHGLPPVSLVCHNDVIAKNLKNYMILSFGSSKTLRKIVGMLMKDSTRRQDLVQDMIITNTTLREELKMHSELTKNQESMIKEIQNKYSGVTSKLKMSPCTPDDGDQSLNSKKCGLLEAEVKKLNDRIKVLMEEDKKRKAKEIKIFEDLAEKAGKEKFNENTLVIIDSYERKIEKLTNEKKMLGTFKSETPTSNFKLIIRSYERRLDLSRRKLKSLENTIDSLKTDFQMRTSRNIVHAKLKNKAICESECSNLSSSRSDATPSVDVSSKLINLKQQTSSYCYKYLQATCGELGVCDLQQILPAITKLRHNSQRVIELESFFKEVLELTNRRNVIRNPCHHVANDLRCSDKNCTISALEDWSLQMKHLKNLQDSLNNLSQNLFPWLPIKQSNRIYSVPELIEMVDCMMDSGPCKGKCKHDNLKKVDKEQLMGIVRHFQKLFDVPNVAGVFARMSQLYVKSNENNNVMTNIKDILRLDVSSNSLAVVEEISKLCGSENSRMTKQGLISQGKEMVSLLEKLGEQNEFCSVFHDTMQSLMKLLGVNSISQVLPRVESITRNQ